VILVTGASGLLGSKLVARAIEAGKQVTAVSHRYPFRVLGADTRNLDLRDFGAARRLVESVRPSVIIHCAAATNVDWCENNPDHAKRLNVQVPVFLAQLAAGLGSQFLQVSTDSVFDGERGNYSESDAPGPLNVYAKTKLLAEQEVQRAYASSLIARVTFYGWNLQKKQSLAEWILEGLSAGKKVPGFTDVYFCPILANDLAEILLAMIDRGLHGTYNAVGSERISKFDFAKRLALEFGLGADQITPVSIDNANLRATRPHDTSLVTERIGRELGRAMPDVQMGLQRFRQLRERECVATLQSCCSEAKG